MDFENDINYLIKRLRINHRHLTLREVHDLAETLITQQGWELNKAIIFGNSIVDPMARVSFVRRVKILHAMKLWRAAVEQQDAPPRFARFVFLLIPKRNREHLVGDLEEEFNIVVLPQYGSFLARCWYFEQVMLAVGFYLWPTIKKILGLSVLYKMIGR
jgi:hypothetical protein